MSYREHEIRRDLVVMSTGDGRFQFDFWHEVNDRASFTLTLADIDALHAFAHGEEKEKNHAEH